MLIRVPQNANVRITIGAEAIVLTYGNTKDEHGFWNVVGWTVITPRPSPPPFKSFNDAVTFLEKFRELREYAQHANKALDDLFKF